VALLRESQQNGEARIAVRQSDVVYDTNAPDRLPVTSPAIDFQSAATASSG
jgi:hypothetical protein